MSLPEMSTMPIIFCQECSRRVVNNPQGLPEFDDENSQCLLCSCHLDEPAKVKHPPPPSPLPNYGPGPFVAPPSVSRTLYERRDAAHAVRWWSKVFKEEFGLDFPRALAHMMYAPPRVVYNALKLDKELLDIKLEAHEN